MPTGTETATSPTVVEHVPRYYRPVYTKVAVAEKPILPLVIFTSYAHVPPLQPAPRLKYDLRSTPDPPKSIRDAHTGMSKKLREHMLRQDAFVELLDKAEGDIRAKMPVVEREVREGVTPTSPVLARRRTWSQQKYSDDEEEDGERNGYDEDEDEYRGSEEEEVEYGLKRSKSKREEESGDEDDLKDRPVLRVGVFCERGQHRSVAFIEELAAREFPKDWEIRIVHRDLGKKKGAVNKGKGGRKPPVRTASLVLEDD